MDEMKIGSKFTTSIISKLASLAIRKKFGYDVKLNLNEVKATVVDGKTHVHLDKCPVRSRLGVHAYDGKRKQPYSL